MSYVKNKLSVEDKDILNNIFDELENINIPTTFKTNISNGANHAVKTGATTQRDARQTLFGIYNGKKTKSNELHPHMMKLFKKFIDSHQPDFKFKNVYVNRNVVSKKHLDSGNVGMSLLVGLGVYTGGRTILHIKKPNGEYTAKKFHIKTNSLIFNGSEIPHESEHFKGIRYSLVFF